MFGETVHRAFFLLVLAYKSGASRLEETTQIPLRVLWAPYPEPPKPSLSHIRMPEKQNQRSGGHAVVSIRGSTAEDPEP